MNKKNRNFVRLTAIGVASVIMLSGCGITEMSDAQMKLISDYAADVLIRYDASYYDRFAKEKDSEKVEDNTVTASNETEPPKTKVPDQENAVTENPVTEQPAATEEPVNNTTPAHENSPESAPSNQEPVPAVPVMAPGDIGKLFGFKDVEVSYKGYEILDKYPSN